MISKKILHIKLQNYKKKRKREAKTKTKYGRRVNEMRRHVPLPVGVIVREGDGVI